VRIPEHLIIQLESSADPVSAGISMTVNTIRRLRAIEGLAGVHLLFHPQRLNLMGDIVTQAGLRDQSNSSAETLLPLN
jgi:hypothetical protein